MKKLLLFAGLLICMFASAQDIGYLQKLKALPSETDALSVANEIAMLSTHKLRLYKTKDTPSQKNLRYVFVPADLMDKDVESRKYSNAQAANFIVIDFTYFNEGENKDLEKQGVKMFRLSTIESKYLNIFPFWKKHFKSDADVEHTIDDYKSQHLKDYQNNLNFYIHKDGDSWTLRNQS